MANPRTPEDFWAKVGPPDHRGCRRWLSRKHHSRGYGTVFWEGKIQFAHRVAWMLHARQEVPPGLWVLHSCSVRACCAPEHLRVGTPQENAADAAHENRGARGSRCHHAKLTEAQVDQLRDVWRTGWWTQQELADLYGITQGQVSRVVRQVNWKDDPRDQLAQVPQVL